MNTDRFAAEPTYTFLIKEKDLDDNIFKIKTEDGEIELSFNSLLSVELSASQNYQGIFSFLREEENFQYWSDFSQSWEDRRIFIQDVQPNGVIEEIEVFPTNNPWGNFPVVDGQTYDDLVSLEQGLK